MNFWLSLFTFSIVLTLLAACNGSTSPTETISAPLVSTYSADKIQNRVLLGAYLEKDGWDEEVIDAFNNKLNKPVSIINVFSSFDMNWDYLKYQNSNVVSRHAIPMISWMPTINQRPNDSLLPEITNGEWDDYIYEWINGFRLWLATYQADHKPTIMIRFAHELNTDGFPWGNQPNELINAWRHLHRQFVLAGVSQHIEWVWNVNNVDVDDYNDFSVYYPGDDVVDWVSIDGYNWGSNYHYTHWKSFDETFSRSYVKLATDFPNKPIMIAEVASAEPSDLPKESMGQLGDDSDNNESKEAWINDMLINIENNYPAIKAVLLFNSNKELNWAIDSDHNSGLKSFNSGIDSTHYVTLDELSQTTSRPVSEYKLPEVVGTESLQKEVNALKLMTLEQRRELRRARFSIRSKADPLGFDH